MSARSSGSRWLRALAPVALFAFAFAVRALSWPRVISDQGVHGLEPDAWYHLRRIVYALRNVPDQLGFDPFLNFPHGARSIWPPLFDAVIAFGMRPWVAVGDAFGPADAARVEWIGVWIPPLVGASTVVTTWLVARRHFGVGTALLAGVLLSVLPAGFWYARVGFLDHHVAVAWLSALLVGAGMELLRAFHGGAGDEGRGWRPLTLRVVLLGILQALLLQVWPGALLHVAAVDLGLLFFWLSRRDAGEAVRFGFAFAGVLAVSCLLAGVPGAPPPPAHLGVWSPSVASFFQPLVFGGAALVATACALLWRWIESESAKTRALHVIVLGCVAAGLALLLLPGLSDGIVDAFAWLTRREDFQSRVLGSRPLLDPGGTMGPLPALVRLSGFGVLFPVVWCAYCWTEWRGTRRPERMLLAVYALVLACATLQQARFSNSFSVPLAILSAWGVCFCVRRVRARGWQPRTAALLAVVVVLSLLAPSVRALRIDLSNQIAMLRGEPIVLSPEDRYWRALEEVATWIRAQTPAAGDAWDASARPTYGLLGHWQTGHLLLYRGERPAVVGNFGDDVPGDNFRLSFEYFRAPEEKAVELLDALGARYVVVRPIDVSSGAIGNDAILDRLAHADVGAARWHRLVFERKVLRETDEKPRAHFRVFERVAGAEVRGRTRPNAVVVARLPYLSPTGREGSFVRRTRADREGRYQLTLPVATVGGPPGVVTAGSWRIARRLDDAPTAASGEETSEPALLVVAERQVREGGVLPGPDLL